MTEAFDVVQNQGTSAHEANGLHEQYTNNLGQANASDGLRLAAGVAPAGSVPNMVVDAAVSPAFLPPDEVATAQSELASLGYCTGVNGVYDWDTANATAEFQEMNNLPITGDLDPLTMEELASGEGVPNPLPCGSWDGPPIQIEGPGGVVIWIGEGHEHGGGWHSDPGHHGWHDGHGHGGE